MEQEYDNRRFVIFEVTELPLIDFSQVYETDIDTVRKSVDETKTFVKYDLPEPSSVTVLTTKSQEYTYEEILNILATPEWSNTGSFVR
jgi:homogentisate 1,2-dioxygenase